MQRWTSQPLKVPLELAVPFVRADLEVESVEHDGPSSYVMLYFNLPDADEHTGRDVPQFAGAFSLFAHGSCWGDPGHCEVPSGPVTAFDRRPPHPLTPINITVRVTDALRKVTNGDVTVTMLTFPVLGSDRDESLRFSRLTLLTYD
jgi:tyrosinase